MRRSAMASGMVAIRARRRALDSLRSHALRRSSSCGQSRRTVGESRVIGPSDPATNSRSQVSLTAIISAALPAAYRIPAETPSASRVLWGHIRLASRFVNGVMMRSGFPSKGKSP